MTTTSTNCKILEFRDYVDKYERAKRTFKEQQNLGIISFDEVREKRAIMTKKLEKLVLEIHPYSLKQMSGSDTRWYTTVKKEGCKRRIVKKNTYEELIDYLIDFYSLKEARRKITLRTMYPVWIKFKESCVKKEATLHRIEGDWKRYYLNDPIIDVPLDSMTRNQITAWLNGKIKAGVTDAKRFHNMKTIMKNIFEYCYSEELIDVNTFSMATYNKELIESYCKPTDESQVFTKEEVANLIELAYKEFNRNTAITTYLAIPLLFQTGLRCGEVVALETTDYDRENKILHISKSEIKLYKKNSEGFYSYNGTTVGAPKKKASVRDIPLTDEACNILDLIIKTNEDNHQKDKDFLFVSNNKRARASAVLKRIHTLCKKAEIADRSTHKIRKTTLSTMLDTCLKDDIADISAIRLFAGHCDESTLLKSYTFSTRKEETRELATKALDFGSWKHLETSSEKTKIVGSP